MLISRKRKMTLEIKERRRKRLKRKRQDNPYVHNIIAKDLRTPKYKMRVVQDKREKNTRHNLLKAIREEVEYVSD